jgi:hypothetical protein
MVDLLGPQSFWYSLGLRGVGEPQTVYISMSIVWEYDGLMPVSYYKVGKEASVYQVRVFLAYAENFGLNQPSGHAVMTAHHTWLSCETRFPTVSKSKVPPPPGSLTSRERKCPALHAQ